MQFTEITENDLDYILQIYNYYIERSNCIYFTEPLTKETLLEFLPFNHAKYKTYVASIDNQPIGLCYYGKFKPREAFDITSEVTIYIDPKHTHKGYGQKMLAFLEEQIQLAGIKNVVATVDSENRSSLHLLECRGYRCVGEMKDIAVKYNQPLTMLIYQKAI